MFGVRSLKRTTQSAASICWPQPLPEYVSVGMTTAQLLHHWGFSWSFASVRWATTDISPAWSWCVR